MKKHLIWLPLLIVSLWYAKNSYYFDVFGASSWGQISFYKMTTWQIPLEERVDLHKRGKLSVFATQPPFGRLWRYGVPETVPYGARIKTYPRTPHRFVPALDISEAQPNGSNLNHWIYLVMARNLKDDNFWALNHYPKLFYFKTLPQAWWLSFQPVWTWFISDSSKTVDGKIVYTHRRAENLNKLSWTVGTDKTYILIILMYLIAIIGGVWLCVRQ